MVRYRGGKPAEAPGRGAAPIPPQGSKPRPALNVRGAMKDTGKKQKDMT